MAYNIAANQILGKPVDAYYRGRALRLGERESEQALQMNDQLMEARESG